MTGFDIQYDQLPDWIKQRERGRGSLTIEGVLFPYVVVDRNLPGAPRWFIGRDKVSEVYFVSDEIGELERELMLRHEMYELGMLEGKGIGRCELALFYELSHCPRDKWASYLRFRLEAFRELMRHVHVHSGNYTDDQRREMEIALSRLERLATEEE